MNVLVNVHPSSAVAKYLKADGEQELSGLSTLQQAFVAGSQALVNVNRKCTHCAVAVKGECQG